MKKTNLKFYSIFLRYLFLAIVSLPNLYLFYLIFTPLTVYPVYFLFSLFFDTVLQGNIIFVGEKSMELIGACIAGSAYFLLLILNLSTPKINFEKRIKIIAFSFAVFLLINILRIFVFGLIFFYEFAWFDIAHEIFWYIGSIAFVIGIWFGGVKLFKIKEIPFYSDIKFIYKKSNLRKVFLRK